MADLSSIEWTDATWNPVTGCTKVSPGCRHCYAERMARRLQAMRVSSYCNGFRLVAHEHLVALPLRWRKPRRVFVNSMSDLFHEELDPAFVRRVFAVMNTACWHRFQVLTKRAKVLAELAPGLQWSSNIWVGVSIEGPDYLWRADLLRGTPAAVRFLSLEPLLAPVSDLDLTGIDWVIVGGESGPGARPMNPEWVIDIRDRCIAESVPFFFKQWGGVQRTKAGRQLEGREWNEFPHGCV